MRKNLSISKKNKTLKILCIGLVQFGADNASAQSATINDFSISRISNIPHSQHTINHINSCFSIPKQPHSEAGKRVHTNGWGVISEVYLGPYTFVSFASKFEQGTSGTCKVLEGNVGVFWGTELRAIIYAKDSSESSISALELVEGGFVRAFSNHFGEEPIFDISLSGSDVELIEVRKFQTFCAGRALVPNIYGFKSLAASQLLQNFDWRPVVGPDDLFGREMELKASGLNEVQGCSGTGLAHCLLRYQNELGYLDVVTIGEFDETIYSYTVTCDH